MLYRGNREASWQANRSRPECPSSSVGANTAGGGLPSVTTAAVDCRIAANLRFSDAAADLQVRGVGLNQPGRGGEEVRLPPATLPDDTATGLGLPDALTTWIGRGWRVHCCSPRSAVTTGSR